MAGLNTKNTRTPRKGATSPIRSVTTSTTTNHEGATAFSRDAKSDLFLLGVTNFGGEDTFYETGKNRDTRFAALVQQVTQEDPQWVANFAKWLRNVGNMRTASIVMAAEYVAAGGPNGRQVVRDVIVRGDEPAEMIAYGLNTRGLSQPVKRGVADAVRALYTEHNVLKYNSSSDAVRMADVLQLTHARPTTPAQSALFKYLLASRYNNDAQIAETLPQLPVIAANRRYRAMNPAKARDALLMNEGALASAGMTWESLSSFGPMDKDAWEAVIPQMGYMALLRNLRNFDAAGVSDKVAKTVAAKLSDPAQVAKSRQLPFRFLSAYRNAPSLRWSTALEEALDLATQNVPIFKGNTLVLVDTSASMTSMPYSLRGTVTPADAAALFGAVLTKRNVGGTRLMGFADRQFEHKVRPGSSALTIMTDFVGRTGEVGHGTCIAEAVNRWEGEDRIIILTDLQSSQYFSRSAVPTRNDWYRQQTPAVTVPTTVPIYSFNLAGYETTGVGNSKDNEFELGGLTDQTFKLIPMIEAARNATWPWES